MNGNRKKRAPRDGRVADGVHRPCEHPDCPAPGEYRAPRGPGELRSYRWFCLDHVRAFNQSWDYFAGWSQAEIERFQRESVTGHRPTWPLGERRADEARYQAAKRAFRDFAREWLDEEIEDEPGGARASGRQRNGNGDSTGFEARAARHRSEWSEALAVLELEPPVSREALKRRYKELAKRHHPDANGGCRESEERLKLINRAYTYLRQQIVV